MTRYTVLHLILMILFFIADEDYKKEIVILTFSPDDDQKCFNVSITDDSIHEEDEVFFANITTSDPQIILSQPMANLTIDGIANNNII